MFTLRAQHLLRAVIHSRKKIYLRWLESGWARGSSGLTCHLGGQDDLLLSTLHSWTWVAARWCVGEKKRSFV